MRRRWIAVLLVVGMISCLLHASPVSSQDYDIHESGPYIDKLVYIVIPNATQRIHALQGDYTEMDTGFISPSDMPILQADPNINVHQFLRNGYGQITFNCREYPLNISGFRRAFAHAFDKTSVIDALEGYAQVHDSLIPYINEFCIEEDLDWHWYMDESDTGNAILDDLNFTIDPLTGFRVAPNGEPVGIHLRTLNRTNNDDIVLIAREAFEALHVGVVVDDPSVYNLPEVYVHERDFDDYDISWLASEYGSEFVNDTMTNLSGLSNSTYDMWGEQLRSNPSYEAVYHAASEMQEILHHEVPSIVAYQNIYYQAYRNDRFKDHVEDIDRHMTGLWTMMNIKKLDSTRGGTLLVSVDAKPDSFNPFTAESSISKAIFDKLLLGLYTRTPDLNSTPQIAKEMTVERHRDNPLVPKGNTRYTIDVNTDLRWTDRVNVTAYDIAFTFNYIIESGKYGNPMAEDLTDLFTVYAPSPFRMVFEFSSESYWNFEKFAYKYILPKHILEDYGYEEWDSWSLTTGENPYIECISNGPFEFTDYEENEFYELRVNFDWLDEIYHELPTSDVYLESAGDFTSLFSSFSLRWNLNWEPDPWNRASGFYYTILLDGEHYQTGRWHYSYSSYYGPDTISLNINEPYMTQGTHNFTIIVESLYHGLEIDTVIVTVQISMYQVTPILGLVLPFAITGFFMAVRKTLKPRRVIEMDRGPGISGQSIIL